MRLQAQTESRLIWHQLLRRTLKSLIINQVHLTLQTTRSASVELEAVEQAQAWWSTTPSYSRSTLRDQCWLRAESSTFDAGSSGTTMEGSTSSKRDICEHPVNHTRSIQLIQTTCSLIWRTMLSRKRVKTTELMKTAIKSVILLSRSTARPRLTAQGCRATPCKTIWSQLSRSSLSEQCSLSRTWLTRWNESTASSSTATISSSTRISTPGWLRSIPIHASRKVQAFWNSYCHAWPRTCSN